MTSQTRWTKIEQQFTPRQIVQAWLADVIRRFGEMEKYVEWLADQPASLAPVNVVSDSARTAVQTRMKGQPKDDASVAEEQAVREAVFLVNLVLQCYDAAAGQLEQYGLQAALCARSLQLLLLADALGADAQRAFAFPYTGIAGIRGCVEEHLAHVYLCGEVIRGIQARYFAGGTVLFPDLAGELERAVCVAESLAGEYNRQAIGRGARPGGNGSQAPQASPGGGGPEPDTPPEPCPGIDLAGVAAAAKAGVAKEIDYIVRVAKAHALDTLGRHGDAVQMAKAAYEIICPPAPLASSR